MGKELAYFFHYLKVKKVIVGDKEQDLTFTYIANHLCKGGFGKKNKGIRTRCKNLLNNRRKNSSPFHNGHRSSCDITDSFSVFPESFLCMSDSYHKLISSSSSDSSDSDSTSSSSRPLIKKTTPEVTQKVKKTPLPPTKTNINKYLMQWSHQGEDNSGAVGHDMSQFTLNNVCPCNRLFAIDPNEYDPKVYPVGVLLFIEPQQMSPDKNYSIIILLPKLSNNNECMPPTQFP